MIETLGLRHIHLHVRDPERSVQFYRDVFGGREEMREGELVFVRLPSGDLVTLNGGDPRHAGEMGGIAHFGFGLKSKADLDEAVRAVEEAGGRLVRRGEHAPGHPFAYLADPDGYVFEL
jgi:catechol 2,3-dioxygenase-like lactoylglutathione lyase family enzyme